ncbi:MAG: hypothetical protein IKH26_04195 [Bacteroidaceae bacterium]|nr:hypothetical protein [Bacteroidaceae bacterium]
MSKSPYSQVSSDDAGQHLEPIPDAPYKQGPPPDTDQRVAAYHAADNSQSQAPHREVKPSMNRRAFFNDYKQRRIYMITMQMEAHAPSLGELCADLEETETGRVIHNARIKPSLLGKAIHDCWLSIPHYHPEVTLVAFQLMPDHFHGLLFVTREMEKVLGKILNGFKTGCHHAFRDLYLEQAAESSRIQCQNKGKADCPGFLFKKGYNDSILIGEDQLERMVAYIYDNPRRLAIRRLQSDFFRVLEGIKVAGRVCSAQGNIELLRRPCAQVRVSRSAKSEDLEVALQHFLALGGAGTVLVSPCISQGEKMIMRKAFDMRLPQIILLDKGINPRSKPFGERFESCAEGRLLSLSPFPCSYSRKNITREECELLNDLAKAIAEASQKQTGGL